MTQLANCSITCLEAKIFALARMVSGMENEKQMTEKASKNGTADQITILIGSLHSANPMLLLKLHLHGERTLSMQIDVMLSSFFASSRFALVLPRRSRVRRLNIGNIPQSNKRLIRKINKRK